MYWFIGLFWGLWEECNWRKLWPKSIRLGSNGNLLFSHLRGFLHIPCPPCTFNNDILMLKHYVCALWYLLYFGVCSNYSASSLSWIGIIYHWDDELVDVFSLCGLGKQLTWKYIVYFVLFLVVWYFSFFGAYRKTRMVMDDYMITLLSIWLDMALWEFSDQNLFHAINSSLEVFVLGATMWYIIWLWTILNIIALI